MKLHPSALLLLFAVLASGCTLLTDAFETPSNPNPSAWGPVLPPELAPKTRANSRPLRPGDKVAITIHTNVSQGNGSPVREDVVDQAGNVKLPLVEEIRVATLTTEEAEDAIRSAYVSGGFYNSVTVRVVCPEMLLEQLYFVDGETHKTGSFPFRDNITLQQAIINEPDAYYALPCCPSPYHGFQEAFGLTATYGDIEGAIKNLAVYLNEHNAVNRFSTWALPINMSMINGGFKYACAYAEGKTDGKVDVEYLQKCYSEAAGSDIEFTKYVDASGNTYDNYLLIALEPINFADYLGD